MGSFGVIEELVDGSAIASSAGAIDAWSTPVRLFVCFSNALHQVGFEDIAIQRSYSLDPKRLQIISYVEEETHHLLGEEIDINPLGFVLNLFKEFVNEAVGVNYPVQHFEHVFEFKSIHSRFPALDLWCWPS